VSERKFTSQISNFDQAKPMLQNDTTQTYVNIYHLLYQVPVSLNFYNVVKKSVGVEYFFYSKISQVSDIIFLLVCILCIPNAYPQRSPKNCSFGRMLWNLIDASFASLECCLTSLKKTPSFSTLSKQLWSEEKIASSIYVFA
jgi:hypothetical protein